MERHARLIQTFISCIIILMVHAVTTHAAGQQLSEKREGSTAGQQRSSQMQTGLSSTLAKESILSVSETVASR